MSPPIFAYEEAKLERSNHDFARGYFCAVAALLNMTCQLGVADTHAKALFSQGGNWRNADPEDIETFKEHGLIPDTPTARTGKR